MSDNKNLTGHQDRVLIDSKSPSEVEYVHKQFPDMKHDEILNAIKSKGPFRKDVMEYLEKLKNG